VDLHPVRSKTQALGGGFLRRRRFRVIHRASVWGCTAVDVESFDIDQEGLLDHIEIVGGDGGFIDPAGTVKMYVSWYLGEAIRAEAVEILSNPICSGR